jgi:hypothetical protein
VTVSNCTFTGNSAIGRDPTFGGGIYNGGPLTVNGGG